jgi:Ca2+-binding EF-hand superfamily protein
MMLSITVEKDILESFGIMAELDEQNRRVITFESLRAVMGKMDSKLSDEDIRNMIE